MKDQDAFERWLREAASDEEVKQRVRSLADREALPDDVLARFRAGELSPEELALFEDEIALNPRNLAAMAEMDADLEAAANEVAPSPSLLDPVRRWFAELSLGRAMSYAGAAAMLVLAIIAGQALFDGPPTPGALFNSQLIGAPRGQPLEGFEHTLPWGQIVERVDPAWPVAQPVGDVRKVKWLAWNPLDQAETYTVRIYTSAGQLIYEQSELAEPHVKLPSQAKQRLVQGEAYVWVIEAQMGWDYDPIRAVAYFQLTD